MTLLVSEYNEQYHFAITLRCSNIMSFLTWGNKVRLLSIFCFILSLAHCWSMHLMQLHINGQLVALSIWSAWPRRSTMQVWCSIVGVMLESFVINSKYVWPSINPTRLHEFNTLIKVIEFGFPPRLLIRSKRHNTSSISPSLACPVIREFHKITSQTGRILKTLSALGNNPRLAYM